MLAELNIGRGSKEKVGIKEVGTAGPAALLKYVLPSSVNNSQKIMASTPIPLIYVCLPFMLPKSNVFLYSLGNFAVERGFAAAVV